MIDMQPAANTKQQYTNRVAAVTKSDEPRRPKPSVECSCQTAEQQTSLRLLEAVEQMNTLLAKSIELAERQCGLIDSFAAKKMFKKTALETVALIHEYGTATGHRPTYKTLAEHAGVCGRTLRSRPGVREALAMYPNAPRSKRNSEASNRNDNQTSSEKQDSISNTQPPTGRSYAKNG